MGNNPTLIYIVKRRIKIEIIMMMIELITTHSGLIFTPFVSSSKNLNKPALEAGNGASRFLFLLPLIPITYGRKWLKSLTFKLMKIIKIKIIHF